MTEEEDKLKRFLEMTDHPEGYTDEELQTLLADDDMRAWYEALVAAADAKAANEMGHAQPDEVEEVLGSITAHRPQLRRRWLRIAASVIGIVLMSGIVYASIHILRHKGTPVEKPVVVAKADTLVPRQQPITPPEVRTFDDMPLDSILATVARQYKLQVTYRDEALKSLRLHVYWYPDKSVDHFIEVINQFDGIHIVHEGNQLIVEPTTEEETE